MRRVLLVIAVTGCLASTVRADVRLPKVFGDHMVLQREKPVNVWGWANAGEAVTVTFGEAIASTKAEKDGKWHVQLPARKASSTPREFSVAGNNKIVLSFDHVGGGLKTLDGKAPTHFAIAGADKKFVSAKATIKGDTIEVTSPDVAAPVAVRFAWHETAISNLANKEALPASPFRTDNWTGGTGE